MAKPPKVRTSTAFETKARRSELHAATNIREFITDSFCRQCRNDGNQICRQNRGATMKPRGALLWVRTPLSLDFFRGWSRPEERLWHIINRATQTNTRKGRISVPALAWFTSYSERQVYRILRRLKTRGAIYALVTLGVGAVYYLPFQYRAPTPDNKHVRGANGVNLKEEIDNYRCPPRYGRRNGPRSVRDDREPLLISNSYEAQTPDPDAAEFAKEGLLRTMERDRLARAGHPNVWQRPASWERC